MNTYLKLDVFRNTTLYDVPKSSQVNLVQTPDLFYDTPPASRAVSTLSPVPSKAVSSLSLSSSHVPFEQSKSDLNSE